MSVVKDFDTLIYLLLAGDKSVGCAFDLIYPLAAEGFIIRPAHIMNNILIADDIYAFQACLAHHYTYEGNDHEMHDQLAEYRAIKCRAHFRQHRYTEQTQHHCCDFAIKYIASAIATNEHRQIFGSESGILEALRRVGIKLSAEYIVSYAINCDIPEIFRRAILREPCILEYDGVYSDLLLYQAVGCITILVDYDFVPEKYLPDMRAFIATNP